jgi:hypothetical protein
MPMTYRPARTAFIVLFAIALLLAGSAVAVLAQAQDTSIDGQVSALNGNTLTLTLADGSSKAVSLLPDTLVLAREAATLESIKPMETLGVAARRESDGSLTANNINIFSPELWYRVRKGQFPMQSGDVMTNALVTDYVLGVQGRVLRMRYHDLMTTINVPVGARVSRLITEPRADLKAGLHVLIRGTASAQGGLAAGSVIYDLPAKG